MRPLLFFAFVIGLAVVAVKVTDARGPSDDMEALSSVPAGTPPEVAGVVRDLEGARAKGMASIGGGLLRRKAASAPASVDGVAAPFADAGPAPRIARVKRAVRRELRASAGDGMRLRVLAWQGVIVVGSRAAVRADVEQVVRTRTGPMVRAPKRMTLGLVAGGGWHLVSSE